MNTGQRVVLGSMAAIVVLATARQLATKPGLPPPGIYVGAGLWASIWFMVGSFAPGFAGVVMVGTVFAALLAPYAQGGSGTSPLTQLAGLVGQVSGGISPAGSSGSSAAAAHKR